MIELSEVRDRRRAALEPWICEGVLKEGGLKGKPCRQKLMYVDFDRPAAIRKDCDRCGHTNVFVEAYRRVT